MKDELQGKLVEILTAIQNAAGKASDFALSQLPDIAQSYVAYGRAYLTALMVLSVAAMLAICLVAWRVNLAASKKSYHDPFMIFFPAGFLTLFAAMGVLKNASEFAMVWLAPKVWLLKEIAHMVR